MKKDKLGCFKILTVTLKETTKKIPGKYTEEKRSKSKRHTTKKKKQLNTIKGSDGGIKEQKPCKTYSEEMTEW